MKVDEFHEIEVTIEIVITLVVPGRYVLSDLLGEAWAALEPKPTIGAWFKRRVITGQLQGVEHCGKNARNHQVYYVNGRAA